MPTVNVIAKKDFYPLFKKGDKLQVVPVLYEKDVLLVNKIYGVFVDGVLTRFYDPGAHNMYPKNAKIIQIFDEVYAPKGSYKDSFIRLEDGREYPGSHFRDYNDYFEKVVA